MITSTTTTTTTNILQQQQRRQQHQYGNNDTISSTYCKTKHVIIISKYSYVAIISHNLPDLFQWKTFRCLSAGLSLRSPAHPSSSERRTRCLQPSPARHSSLVSNQTSTGDYLEQIHPFSEHSNSSFNENWCWAITLTYYSIYMKFIKLE